MFFTSSGSYSFTVDLANEAATYRLVNDVAALIESGDMITLSGDLGAGKTTFARAFIRHVAGDSTIEVPSPTFTLTQTYALPRFSLVHTDLYRLSGPGELTELGFGEASDGAVTLLEWPDRATGFLPADRLDIALTLVPQHGPNARSARVTGYGSFAARAERILTIRQFLDRVRIRPGRTPPYPGRCLDAQLRAAHPRPRNLCPDEFAEETRWTAGAGRQAL